MIAPWPAIALVLAALAGWAAVLKVFERAARPHAELTRKLMHVGMGLLVLGFPWLFDRQWPVLLLSGVATAMLLATKVLPRWRDGIGSVVTRVQRPTLGEVYFPVAVGALFFLSGGDALLFGVPMLIVTLADATAALIGIAYGRARFLTQDGFKSVEGSIAFLLVAFLSVHVPLLLSGRTGRAESLLIAAVIALMSTLIEAIAWRGLDNLAIPLGAFAFLSLYEHKSAAELVPRLLANAVLLAFVLPWRRRSSLDDGALLGCALFGYGAWMLGGWPWLVGPMALLALHAWLWPRRAGQREHGMIVLLSVLAPALLWLGLFVAVRRDVWFLAYAVTFGVNLAMIGLSRSKRVLRIGRLIAWTAAGWALATVQLAARAPWHHAAGQAVALLLIAGAAVATGTFAFAYIECGRAEMKRRRYLVACGITVGISVVAVVMAWVFSFGVISSV